jgi:hypothetical protein
MRIEITDLLLAMLIIFGIRGLTLNSATPTQIVIRAAAANVHREACPSVCEKQRSTCFS